MEKDALEHVLGQRDDAGDLRIFAVDESLPAFAFVGLIEAEAVGREHGNRHILAEKFQRLLQPHLRKQRAATVVLFDIFLGLVVNVEWRVHDDERRLLNLALSDFEIVLHHRLGKTLILNVHPGCAIAILLPRLQQRPFANTGVEHQSLARDMLVS